jgi:2,3-bisphosphoglycerate-dependent phosphoglycerate mutase
MPQLAIVRHGQSQWNLENRFTGWVDVPLTPKGEEEAKTAGDKLKGYTFNAAFTSNLQRAQRTLEIIKQRIGNTGLPTTKNVALNERMYGDLQGKNKDETRDKYGDEQVHIWRRSFDIAPPGGESLKDTCDRVLPYYASEIEPALRAQQNVLIVAHGNSLRALIMHLEYLSPEQILAFELGTGIPRVYDFSPDLNLISASFI